MSQMLVCPITKLPLQEASLRDAEVALGSDQPLVRNGTPARSAAAPFHRVLLRSDRQAC